MDCSKAKVMVMRGQELMENINKKEETSTLAVTGTKECIINYYSMN